MFPQHSIQAEAPLERLLWALCFPRSGKENVNEQKEKKNTNSNHQTELITAVIKAVPRSKKARLPFLAKNLLK